MIGAFTVIESLLVRLSVPPLPPALFGPGPGAPESPPFRLSADPRVKVPVLMVRFQAGFGAIEGVPFCPSRIAPAANETVGAVIVTVLLENGVRSVPVNVNT